mgnify:FL=1
MSETDIKNVRVLISGRVQGVCFRACTRDQAQILNLSGWVRNLSDGRVEALFEGASEVIDQMLEWCKEGAPSSSVSDIEVFEEEASTANGGAFEIRY